MSQLSSALRETLAAIRAFIESEGLPPTYQEIANLRGIKAPSAHEQVMQLVELGYLRQAKRRSRNLELVEPPPSLVEDSDLVAVPILGEVPAGQPLFCEENVLGEVMVERRIVGRARCFALEVIGESMKDADILPGDYVVVRQQPIAENGEIVVATVNGEATLKRLRLYPDRWELHPENPAFQIIQLLPEDDLRIVGKVVGISRNGNNNEGGIR